MGHVGDIKLAAGKGPQLFTFNLQLSAVQVDLNRSLKHDGPTVKNDLVLISGSDLNELLHSLAFICFRDEEIALRVHR